MLVLMERCEPFWGGASETAGGAWGVDQLAEGVVSVEWALSGGYEETARPASARWGWDEASGRLSLNPPVGPVKEPVHGRG
jgi:hypothetical protein